MRHILSLTGLAFTLATVGPRPALAVEPGVSQSPMTSLSLTRLDGSALPKEALAGKTVLFVNVASQCGYTGQYAGLQELYTRYADKGLVIVGVPCNQFGGQEPGSPEQIASFCQQNFGVSFPLLEKQAVNGPKRSELYQWLVGTDPSSSGDVRWNFEKFLVGPDGTVKERFKSNVAPDDARLSSAIEAALGEQS